MYLANYKITSLYGPRGGGFHHGVDFGTLVGTPLPALTAGRVVFARWTAPAATYPDGTRRNELLLIVQSSGFFIVYGHLSDVLVSEGQQVSVGQTVARSGNSGYVLPQPTASQPNLGQHLHIEQRLGLFATTISAHPSIDIMPLLQKYQGGTPAKDTMTKEQFNQEFVRTLGDVIAKRPHYDQDNKPAFEGHVGRLNAFGDYRGVLRDFLRDHRWLDYEGYNLWGLAIWGGLRGAKDPHQWAKDRFYGGDEFEKVVAHGLEADRSDSKRQSADARQLVDMLEECKQDLQAKESEIQSSHIAREKLEEKIVTLKRQRDDLQGLLELANQRLEQHNEAPVEVPSNDAERNQVWQLVIHIYQAIKAYFRA